MRGSDGKDMVEGSVFCVGRGKVLQVLNKMKTANASGPLDV